MTDEEDAALNSCPNCHHYCGIHNIGADGKCPRCRPKSDDEITKGHFIDVSTLATPRMRRIAQLLEPLPAADRQELADLIFSEVDEQVKEVLHIVERRVRGHEPAE